MTSSQKSSHNGPNDEVVNDYDPMFEAPMKRGVVSSGVTPTKKIESAA